LLEVPAQAVTVWLALAGGPAPLAVQVVVRAAMVALVETIHVRSFLFASLLAVLNLGLSIASGRDSPLPNDLRQQDAANVKIRSRLFHY
jgi:hypothetical protein